MHFVSTTKGNVFCITRIQFYRHFKISTNLTKNQLLCIIDSCSICYLITIIQLQHVVMHHAHVTNIQTQRILTTLYNGLNLVKYDLIKQLSISKLKHLCFHRKNNDVFTYKAAIDTIHKPSHKSPLNASTYTVNCTPRSQS